MKTVQDVTEATTATLKRNKWGILKWAVLSFAAFALLMFLISTVDSWFRDSKEDILNEIRDTRDSIHVLNTQLVQLNKANDSLKQALEERGQRITSYEKKVYNVVVPKETNPDKAYDFLKAFAQKNGAN